MTTPPALETIAEEEDEELGSVLVIKNQNTNIPNYTKDSDGQESQPFLKQSEGKSLQILDDFVRFDLSRTGALCRFGYKVSVQYDDDFLNGKLSNGENSRLWDCFSSQRTKAIQFFKASSKAEKRIEKQADFERSYIHFREPEEIPIFTVEYSSIFACFRRGKKRKFWVKLPSRKEIGVVTTHTNFETPLEIVVGSENFSLRKIKLTTFTIENGSKEKVGTIEAFRGIRGGISSYGISTIDDGCKPEAKAVFVAAALALDVEERESELKCSFLWTPLISIVIILLFTILPWIYYKEKRAFSLST